MKGTEASVTSARRSLLRSYPQAGAAPHTSKKPGGLNPFPGSRDQQIEHFVSRVATTQGSLAQPAAMAQTSWSGAGINRPIHCLSAVSSRNLTFGFWSSCMPSATAAGTTTVTVLDAGFREVRTITSARELELFDKLWSDRTTETESALRPL